MFHGAQNKIKRVAQATHPDPEQDQLGKNVQISLATKLQELSGTFRKSQSNYLKSKCLLSFMRFCKVNYIYYRMITTHD
jgi:hypothetical protein